MTNVCTNFQNNAAKLKEKFGTQVRGENTPERKVASTGDRTHNHQVMSLTRSPLSHPGRANFSVTFIFSSAYAFNLNQTKILSSGKVLTLYHTMPHFDTLNK